MNKRLFLIIIFFLPFSHSFSQIVVSTSLEEAINKALTKSSSIKNKELEIEKLQLQEKGVWNKYIPRIEANAEYLYFDNKLSVNLPASSLIPIPGAPVFDGKTYFDNYGNIFNAGIIAKTILFTGFQIENGAKAIKEKTKGT
jgi:hypothetical protein